MNRVWRVGLVAALCGAPAAATPTYSDYERETIAAAVAGRPAIDPAPEGKRIEEVDIVTLEVLEERDPFPTFFNYFHVTSRERVIRRELLFHAGQAYDEERALESARNLRALRQLSLVLIVPLVGSQPDTVRVLVITKDVWSLRLNTDFQFADGELTSLLLQPAEENLFGTHMMVGGLFVLQPATYSLGLQFINRRVAGSRIQSLGSFNLIFNRASGDPEGSFGTFGYGQPLYSAETKWAWKTVIAWRDEIFRSFVGTTLRGYDSDAVPDTPDPVPVPYRYDFRQYYGAYLLTRSLGRTQKNDFSVGVEVDRRRSRLPPTPGVPPQARAEFVRRALPVSDTRASPLLQWRSYTSRYHRVLDFETLGLQEDYRLGHEIITRVYPASEGVASSRTMLGTYVGLGYTVPLGDGLARGILGSTYDLATKDRTDALLRGNLRLVTPRTGAGRLVYDGLLLNRHQNYLNELYTLGGNSRLRGFPPDDFIGKDVVASNLEFRSRGFNLLSLQVGGAAFYDVGDAFDGFDDLRLKQAVGFGLRALFPQANRIVFRADWGFPVTPGYDTFPGSLFITFGQAFGMPVPEPPTLAADFTD